MGEPADLSPVAFAREVLGIDLSDQQVAMLALIYANRRTALAGAHASGKTYAVAIFILWWIWTYTESIALITATKLDQTDRLWNEIRHFWNISPRLRAGLGPTAELLDRTLRITEYRYIERFTAAVSKSGGDAQATGAQGAHVPSGRVLVDIEEADGVQLATYNALEGSMSSANAKMVMQFNPLRRSGPAYNATRSDQWATMHISGFDSPNLAGESVETLMERYDANPDDPWFDEESHNGLTGRRYMLDLWLRCGVHGDRDWYGRGLGVYAPQGERSIFDANQVEGLVVPQEFNRAAASNPRHKLRIGIDWSAARGETVSPSPSPSPCRTASTWWSCRAPIGPPTRWTGRCRSSRPTCTTPASSASTPAAAVKSWSTACATRCAPTRWIIRLRWCGSISAAPPWKMTYMRIKGRNSTSPCSTGCARAGSTPTCRSTCGSR